jgi:hypothetical protein
VRIFLLVILSVIACGCNEHLASGHAPSLPPGRARFLIKRDNETVLSTPFKNVSSNDFLRCHHDRGSQYYIDARRFVQISGQPTDIRMFTLFFPITDETQNGEEVSWKGSSISLYGKMGPYHSLSGPSGTCEANLHLKGNVLSGDISCKHFSQFDFEILGLLCTID